MGMVEFLIVKGADANAKDNRSFTPLHEAVGGKHKDIVALLIDNGADVNARARWDYTPMYYAAWSGITEIVELLVEKGADINVKDEWGQTPLHYMAKYDYHRNMAEFLISKGADVNAADRWGHTALSYAKEKGHTEIVELLLKHGAKEDETPESAPKEKRPSEPNDVELDESHEGDILGKAGSSRIGLKSL
jgi:ankyrin repeat protein